MSLVVVAVSTFFFAGLLLSNIWAVVVFISFVAAIQITAFMSQEDRIEVLEKKLEEMTSRGNQDE